MIDTELPIDALIALTEFLGLTDASTRNLLDDRAEHQRNYRSQIQSEFESIQSTLYETHKLAEVCQTSIIKAESNSVMADRVIKTIPNHGAETSIAPQVLNIPSAALSSRLHYAVHDALLKVMGERDQARANYIASDVLHVHELQQERKRNKRLEEELEMARAPSSDDKTQARLRKQQQEASNDDELMSLCQQLSSEISARTAASLEIERLKEIRETERANESAEKESLQEEISRLKEQLEAEKNASAMARRTSAKWQKSFEDVMEFRTEKPENIQE